MTQIIYSCFGVFTECCFLAYTGLSLSLNLYFLFMQILWSSQVLYNFMVLRKAVLMSTLFCAVPAINQDFVIA